jgi:hypothetical protein
VQIQQKKVFKKKVKKKEFTKGNLVIMFDIQHHHKAYKKLLPKWFGPFVIRKVFVDNGSYELENVDGLPYHINHDKLKKGFGYVIPKMESIMTLGVCNLM